jgi:hypothetical protein
MPSLFTDKQANIFGSREAIRNSLCEMTQDYLDLQDVDLNKTTFVSYIINIFSVLTTNMMFYNANVYKEFFFTEAQMPDSVINLGKWIDYYPPDATPATVDLLFTVYLNKLLSNNITLSIPSTFKAYAGDIPFTLYSTEKTIVELNVSELKSQAEQLASYNVTVAIANKESVIVTDQKGNYYPVELNTQNNTVMFILPFRQEELLYESFSIPYDLEFLQFYSNNLIFADNQVSRLEVYVRDEVPVGVTLPGTYDEWYYPPTASPGSNPPRYFYENWTASESGLYTLSQTDKKYIWTSTYGSGDIFFGNGIFGQQPHRGAHVVTLLYLTKGANGIIVPNAISKWDPILYPVVSGTSTKYESLPFSVSNPAAASGGADLPTLAEIKSQAIAGLRSRQRLVSDVDYDDINEIVPYLPVSYTRPILKRSDLKINEIMMFNALFYQDPNGIQEIVPTRNIIFQWPVDSSAIYTIDSTANMETHLYIPSGSNSYDDTLNSTFETIFNMQIYPDTLTAKYEYISKQLSSTASYIGVIDNYDFYASMNIISVVFTKVVTDDPKYPSIYMLCQVAYENDDIQDYEIEITTGWDNKTYYSSGSHITVEKVLDQNNKILGFGLTFEYVNQIPLDQVDFNIIILGKSAKAINPSQYYSLKEYSCQPIIRRDMSDLMYSYITLGTSENGEPIYKVYDTPVILSAYLNESYFNRAKFDTYVLQKYINNINLTSQRMLTDFNNIKFCDTYGYLINMKYNSKSRTIISRSLVYPPLPVDVEPNDTYIVNGGEGYDLQGNNWLYQIHKFAIWAYDHWEFVQPKMGELVIVNDKYDPLDIDQNRTLTFNGKYWMEPIFNIPLQIELKVVRDKTVTQTSQALIEAIKDALISYYTDKFGLDVNIDRSEISKVARGVSGGIYVEVIKPEIDLRFDYEIYKLAYEQLIEYTPELVMFTRNSISIRVYEQ